ncbi:MAG: DUF456 domain-containing protein [Anaerolineales bacterium]|nr:DUF456 domain-containing protein [Anaerolineales bacterium]
MFEGFAHALGLAFPWFLLVIMGLGLFGLIVPVFPGNTVIWAGALAYGLVDGFNGRAWWFFIPITLLTVVALAADNVLMGAKAKQAGASWLSIGITLVAAFAASIILTPFAGLAAAPLTLFIAEFFQQDRDSKKAWETTRGLMLGCGWAFVARFSLGLVTIGLYLWWVLGGG